MGPAAYPRWNIQSLGFAQLYRCRGLFFALYLAAHFACGLVSYILGFGVGTATGSLVALAIEPLAAWSCGYVALLVVAWWLPKRDIRTQMNVFAGLCAVLSLCGIILLNGATQDMPASSALVALNELPALLLQIVMPPLLVVLIVYGARMEQKAGDTWLEDSFSTFADGLGVASVFVCLVVSVGMLLA